MNGNTSFYPQIVNKNRQSVDNFVDISTFFSGRAETEVLSTRKVMGDLLKNKLGSPGVELPYVNLAMYY
ncbi:hypothetical protein CVD19_11555 [Bacillus sp. T33-2]|nr:hypothetical protein CVD19_11555 [Bacillus sp. T33-2]